MTEAVRSWAARSLSFCSYFNQKYLSIHELYIELHLELLQAQISTFCITIHSVSSNLKQDSSILNLAMICSVHGVKPHLGIKHLIKMAVSRIRYTSPNFRLPRYIKIKLLSHVHGVNPHLGIKNLTKW